MAFDLSMPILVVDDYSTMIRIIRNLLKQLGFENVDDASDGSAALAKMQSKRYGLVISDWNMEPMTGYELLKEVRASPEFSNTPFIMITAESKTENVIAAKKAGVNNYIVKPFNAATLKTKMEAVFRIAGLRSWRAQTRAPNGRHPHRVILAVAHGQPIRPAPCRQTCSKRTRRARQPYFYGLRCSRTDNID